MKLTIEINLDNAAFDDNPDELNEIMEKVVNKMDNMQFEGKLLDSQGNTVGQYEIK